MYRIILHQVNAFNIAIKYLFLASNFNPFCILVFCVFYQISLPVKVGTRYTFNFKTAFLKEATNCSRF